MTVQEMHILNMILAKPVLNSRRKRKFRRRKGEH